jgi:hypothetical protein
VNASTLPIQYVKVKREKTGICNICKQPCELTWDHVPPQGGIDVVPLGQYTILEQLAGRDDRPKHLETQNGVKFRTICTRCNRNLLGTEYDPTLNDFALGVGQFLKTTIKLPSSVGYATKPARLLRALFGHLLAAKSEVEDTKSDQLMRKFVLDNTALLPLDLNVFYWIYPYPHVVVIRDVVMPATRGRFDRAGIFSILKYFPIAYLVTNLREYENLISLSFYCPSSLDTEVRIPIPLAPPPGVAWPEVVDDQNFIAGGGSSAHSSILATPKGTSIRGSTKELGKRHLSDDIQKITFS